METLENRLQKRIHVSLYALVFLTLLLGLSVLLEGCTDRCESKQQYIYFEPVYTSLAELRGGVELTGPQPVQAVGKLYLKDGYLFINEPGEGIHIIDNANPAAPVQRGFLKIPGTYDLAIKGNTLYADSYIDLVLVDLTDPLNPRETGRLENVFSQYNSFGLGVTEHGIITDWVQREEVTILKSDCHQALQPWGGIFHERGIAFADVSNFNKSAAIAPGNGSGPGVGGSMARFTINKDHLYTLDAGNIQAIDIRQEQSPVIKNKMYLNWDIETLFPYGEHIFVGSSSGMHILSISDPSAPVWVSTYQHVRSCDPVVVEGDYAYVTLRSGTTCQGFTNQLEVIDISNLNSPRLVKIYPMHNPHGLGVDNNTLFICDGDQGLKVFDASDKQGIDKNLLAHYNTIHAYDVIPFNDILIMIGKDGILQYDYSDPKKIKLLSHIEVSNAP